jgi:tRNA threonylcarbamoyladenosine biosynthesis protein TsaB
MLDARRMEVYAAVFNSAKEQILKTSAIILEPGSFQEYLERDQVYFIGSGVEKFQKICSHPNANFIENKLPSAKEMLEIAVSKHKISDFENVAYFEPFYLKDFIAG